MTPTQTRSGPGRRPVDPAERKQVLTSAVKPRHFQWLREQAERQGRSSSSVLCEILDAAMQREAEAP